jgi:hypothetical protein
MTRLGPPDTADGSSTTTAPTPHPAPSPAPEPGGRQAEATEPTDDPTGRRDRSYALWLLAAVVVAAVVRAIFAAGNDIVAADETAYLTSGLNLWSGRGFTTLGGGAETHFPPGLPFVLGGVHELLGRDPHTAWSVVTLISTTLLILPLAGIARLIAGTRAAVLTAWIAALAPALVAIPLYSGGSAGPFTLCLAVALWLGLRAASMRPRDTLIASAATGVLVGAAYLIRPEGLLYLFVLVPVLVLPMLGGWRGIRRATAPQWRRAGAVAVLFLIPVALAVVPYVAYLHRETGSWELTGKTDGTNLEAWRATASDNRQVAHAILYEPDRDNRFPEHESMTTLIARNPDAYLAIVNVNFGRLYRTAFNAALTPYPHWSLLPGVLFVLAGFAVWRRRHDRAVLGVSGAIAVPVLTTLAFFVLPRYLIPAAAFACVLVAVGLLELPRRWFRAATVVALVLIASSTVAALHGSDDGWGHPLYGYPEHREAGEWIRDHSRPDDLVMSTNIVPGYYAQRRTVPIPWAQPDRMIDFARQYGVRYLIADDAHGVRFRPQLRKVIPADEARWPGLRPVHTIREPGREPDEPRVTIVYELDPRPEPADGPVPLLDLGESR